VGKRVQLLFPRTVTDSPIDDYTGGACLGGTCSFPSTGQINAYVVSITGIIGISMEGSYILLPLILSLTEAAALLLRA
jgi:hypothetical protein